jgi:hypothetical protein
LKVENEAQAIRVWAEAVEDLSRMGPADGDDPGSAQVRAALRVERQSAIAWSRENGCVMELREAVAKRVGMHRDSV